MKKHLLVVILQLAAAGNDAYWTNHFVGNVRSNETNPIARRFTGTTKGCVVYFSATTAGHLILPWALRKRRHDKLATIAEWEGIADNGISGIYTAEHAK